MGEIDRIVVLKHKPYGDSSPVWANLVLEQKNDYKTGIWNVSLTKKEAINVYELLRCHLEDHS